jgi:probable HAF family extracellular repeat protein
MASIQGRGLGLLAAVVLVSFVTVPVHAAPAYVATPLGTLGGLSGTTSAINATGVVSGLSCLPGKVTVPSTAVCHAVVFADGTVRDLGPVGSTLSNGVAINASGQVAGFALLGNARRALLFANGGYTDLGTLGGADSDGTSINASGQVTGAASIADNSTQHAFLYADGKMSDLGTLGGAGSFGSGINAHGQVTGLSDLPFVPALGSRQHAFLYSGGVMQDLGTLGGGFSSGFALNDAGQVTGQAAVAGNEVTHAFLYSAGVMRDLGTLGGARSIGLAIDSGGRVTGSAQLVDETNHAFLYVDGTMYDLNQLVTGLAGTVLNLAAGINDVGQIAAAGCSPSFICQAFRLDPVPPGSVAPAVAKITAVEYHHAQFDHYFVTANPAEVAALDSGRVAGWSRTGETFNAYSGSTLATAPVCRFFSTAFAPKSSHFYTQDAGECSLLKTYPDWQLEGMVMNIPVPDAVGVCAAGTQPVYRFYNNGQGAAPNHRYATRQSIRAQMLASGWIAEGYGPDGVFMCAPI